MAKNEFHPVEVVQIPRAKFTESIWSLSYSELFSRAERGEDGMSTLKVSNLYRKPQAGLSYQRESGEYDDKGEPKMVYVDVAKGVALMRRGADIFGNDKDRAFLYGQNW